MIEFVDKGGGEGWHALRESDGGCDSVIDSRDSGVCTAEEGEPAHGPRSLLDRILIEPRQR